MLLGCLGWLLNLDFAGGRSTLVAVAEAHDPGERFEAHDTGEQLVAHDTGAVYEAAE